MYKESLENRMDAESYQNGGEIVGRTAPLPVGASVLRPLKNMKWSNSRPLL